MALGALLRRARALPRLPQGAAARSFSAPNVGHFSASNTNHAIQRSREALLEELIWNEVYAKHNEARVRRLINSLVRSLGDVPKQKGFTKTFSQEFGMVVKELEKDMNMSFKSFKVPLRRLILRTLDKYQQQGSDALLKNSLESKVHSSHWGDAHANPNFWTRAFGLSLLLSFFSFEVGQQYETLNGEGELPK
uniref:Uncharacterized protein n=1 Tax=Oryza meridionalis TaxID=40149 RepID=A0A0E0E6W7_9ORYZ